MKTNFFIIRLNPLIKEIPDYLNDFNFNLLNILMT